MLLTPWSTETPPGIGDEGRRVDDHDMTLAEASARSGLARATLRVLIHRRRMAGRKRGRDWFVTPSSLEAYLSSRDTRGRRAADPKAHRR